MQQAINDLRIRNQQALIKPNTLINDLPVTQNAADTIKQARLSASKIMLGLENRLLVIVGPCSIHDPLAAIEYAHLLQQAATHFADELCLFMRVYFEKPRTVVGWKGLISDPLLDGSFQINHGLMLARQLLLELNNLGLPAATEFLDTIIPQYISDLISWSAIGARTSESQIHRELASGLSMPVGFKNNTDGNVKIAIDAVNAARRPHHFLGISCDGTPSIISTTGNESCHIILRGSTTAPNYQATHIQNAANTLHHANLIPHLMIDCSHGNSSKNPQQQQIVVDDITQQIKNGDKIICGVMLESNLVAGKQTLDSETPLVYGQSITDACISWEETFPLLEKLAQAVRIRNS
jgi:3-deoxy-7-phosphoheptulonate synthase